MHHLFSHIYAIFNFYLYVLWQISTFSWAFKIIFQQDDSKSAQPAQQQLGKYIAISSIQFNKLKNAIVLFAIHTSLFPSILLVTFHDILQYSPQTNFAVEQEVCSLLSPHCVSSYGIWGWGQFLVNVIQGHNCHVIHKGHTLKRGFLISVFYKASDTYVNG